MEIELTKEQEWIFLKNEIENLRIFQTHHYRDSFLRRRVNVRMRALNIQSYMEYFLVLKKLSEERELLRKELTINVTRFFRDFSVYKLIKEKIIPNILRYKKERSQFSIRCWSAGCSTGEEAYSLAILFKEVLKKEKKRFNLKILGTDLDKPIIDKAKQGIYGEQQLKELKNSDPFLFQKYFIKREDSYIIDKEVKRLVDFQVGDILSSTKPQNLDLILCRNTVIYFSDETKKRFYHDLYNILNTNGYLILGKTEKLIGPAQGMFKIFNGRESIYFKDNPEKVRFKNKLDNV